MGNTGAVRLVLVGLAVAFPTMVLAGLAAGLGGGGPTPGNTSVTLMLFGVIALPLTAAIERKLY